VDPVYVLFALLTNNLGRRRVRNAWALTRGNMAVFTFLIILILTLSALLYFVVVTKVLIYCKRYNLPELKYTKLFGLFTKKHFVGFYSLVVFGQIVFITWFLITL